VGTVTRPLRRLCGVQVHKVLVTEPFLPVGKLFGLVFLHESQYSRKRLLTSSFARYESGRRAGVRIVSQFERLTNLFVLQGSFHAWVELRDFVAYVCLAVTEPSLISIFSTLTAGSEQRQEHNNRG
jgi:hypothetical protein